MNETEIKLVETTSTEVKNRLVGPEEILRTIDTGALYVGGKGGVPQALVTASTSGPGLEIQDGSDTRSFVTAEVVDGVPTGNFM